MMSPVFYVCISSSVHGHCTVSSFQLWEGRENRKEDSCAGRRRPIYKDKISFIRNSINI